MNASWQYCKTEDLHVIESEPNFIADMERKCGEDEERLQRVHQQAAEELA
jgi:hypothetical protein